MITGLRSSLLSVPGDSRKMPQKAVTIPADVLVLNLEDGVSASLEGIASLARAFLLESPPRCAVGGDAATPDCRRERDGSSQ